MSRTGKLNEAYYARNNTPSFYQFKKKYHFIDDQDRQYMIATKNRQVFQNTRFKTTKSSKEEPVINNYGFVKLYVKLADPSSRWFGYSDIGRSLHLYGKQHGGSYIVILKAQEKPDRTRRTGIIYVKGLGRETLFTLLNS